MPRSELINMHWKKKLHSDDNSDNVADGNGDIGIGENQLFY